MSAFALNLPAMRHGATYFLYDTPSYLMRFNVLGMPAGSVAATVVSAAVSAVVSAVVAAVVVAGAASVVATAAAVVAVVLESQSVAALQSLITSPLTTTLPEPQISPPPPTADRVAPASRRACPGRCREALSKLVVRQPAAGEPPRAPLYHMELNHWIEFVDKDHARYHAYYLTVSGAMGRDVPPRIVAAGQSFDTMERLNGKWLLKTRDVAAKD